MAKYTDEQIKKALLCLAGTDTVVGCNGCAFEDDTCDEYTCTEIAKLTLTLINRQEAEIERLKKANTVLVESSHILATEYVEECTAKAKSEAIKEVFREIDNKCIDLFGNFNHREFINFKKEMVGEG